MARKPTPTHIKLLTGKRGKLPINKKEPKPKGDLFTPPEHLNDGQKKEWTYIIANAPKGMLKRLDRSALESYVVAVDLHRQAVIAVNKSGLIVASPKKKEPMQNPYLAILNKQALIIQRAIGELGFSPSSRSRVQVGLPGGDDMGDRFDDF